MASDETTVTLSKKDLTMVQNAIEMYEKSIKRQAANNNNELLRASYEAVFDEVKKLKAKF